MNNKSPNAKGPVKLLFAVAIIIVIAAVIVTININSREREDVEPTTWETVTTTEKVTAPKQDPISIKDAIERYKTSDTEIGIDVSRWQGSINWTKVKNSGVSFVYIRLGVQDGFGGARSVDKYFTSNIKGALKAGLKVGVYYHSCALTVEDAKEDVKFVLNKLSGYDSDDLALPIAFDWESWESLDKADLTLDEFKVTLNECYWAFEEGLLEKGYKTSLYSSTSFLEDKTWEEKDNIWLAQYTTYTTYEGDFFMWQCCNEGSVPGISGNVDIDVLYIDKLS